MYLYFSLYIIDANDLSGTIPTELGLLTNLEVINLCKYGRRVDLCLEEHGWNPSSTSNFAFFPLLHDALILGNNNLSGSIPSELGLLTNVETIVLRKCGRRVYINGWRNNVGICPQHPILLSFLIFTMH